jgi:hypothetical protein
MTAFGYSSRILNHGMHFFFFFYIVNTLQDMTHVLSNNCLFLRFKNIFKKILFFLYFFFKLIFFFGVFRLYQK